MNLLEIAIVEISLIKKLGIFCKSSLLYRHSINNYLNIYINNFFILQLFKFNYKNFI